MKTTLLTLLLVTIGMVATGCATRGPKPAPAAVLQRLLDRMLPPDFTGDFSGTERIPGWAEIHVKATDLKLGPNGWTFESAEYHRSGPAFSSADFTLGPTK